MQTSSSMFPGEARRIEGVLASARVFLAIASLAAIWIDPTEPSRFAGVAYGLMALYVAFAILVVGLIRWRPASVRWAVLFHAVDVLWPAGISIFTNGPGSPFFLFYTYVLLAAAYRWGLDETLATACATMALFVSEGILVVSSSGLGVFLRGSGFDFDMNRFLMRSFDLFIFGYLLGYLGEEEKRPRQEALAITHAIGKARSAPSLTSGVREVLRDALASFRADFCLLALINQRTEEAFLWEIQSPNEEGERDVTLMELNRERRPPYLFKMPWAAWHGIPKGRVLQLRAADSDGKWSRERWTFPERWLEHGPFRAVLGVSVDYGKEWSGNFLAFGGRHLAKDRVLRFAQSLIYQTGSGLYGAYLTQRLRAEAGAAERARVARELHDGIIQSLVGIEMQVDVLRRQSPGQDGMSQGLNRVQQLLRKEVLNVRELMEQMRPVDVGPSQLASFLASMVDKFGRDTGISANFTCDTEGVVLGPRICHEVARITQEGLANVRRHSGARHVVVSLGQEGNKWKLVIDDDGKGFSFEGRLTQSELDAQHKGPVVIKERARAIGGDLVVDSRPGTGARIEIIIPVDGQG